ncbi:MAG TPA: hypothetical protein VJ872_08880 [Nocardioides sp.]|nr:hypothetical protein [Nocardioides sp.]
MTLKRSALALGAAALMTASLTGCGGSGGAPAGASKDAFCGAWGSVKAANDEGSSRAAFTAIQAAVAQLKDVGTPSDITTDAKAGYDVLVDAVLKATWKDVKGANGAGAFAASSPADRPKLAAFVSWVGQECPA